MKRFLSNIFSIKNDRIYKVITFFGIKIKCNKHKRKFRARLVVLEQKEYMLDTLFMDMHLKLNAINAPEVFEPEKLFEKPVRPLNCVYLDGSTTYIEYLFPNCKGTFNNKLPLEQYPNFFYTCGISGSREHTYILANAAMLNEKVYVIEDSFFRSIFSHVYNGKVDEKYYKSLGFTIDDITHYIDASSPSRLEKMLNDKNLIISDEQKERARKCINRILETNLSKYNNQPMYTPDIGRKNVPKILVVDQAYADWSIKKGAASDETFEIMLDKAIKENPDADIIVKTHPDTMSGERKGYYDKLVEHDNIYKMTDPINPLSLVKYCDKVYVCTTQLGLEALMCGKEVHTFGLPFYAGWGLTIDYQKCERRTNTRTLEELFYIAYIMYSHFVNPDKKCRCEVEEAMEYLINLRDTYFKGGNK